MLFIALFGAIDFVRVLVDDTAYIAETFGPGGVAYFADYPVALRLLWAVTIITSVAAPLMLIALRRLAVPCAVTTVVAQLVLLIITMSFMNRWAALTTGVADLVITAIMAAFAIYSLSVRRLLT